jgi:hypothetical protein
MEKLFLRLANAIMSVHAILLILLFTLVGLLTVTHTLFNEVLPNSIQGFERVVATWGLSVAWEASLLICTVSSQLLPKRITSLMALCSGVIVLFFIHAFANDQPPLEIIKRWFVGVLITLVNFLYTSLFFARWKELQEHKNLASRVAELETSLEAKAAELIKTQYQLTKSKQDVERLVNNVAELEVFKKSEIEKVTCSFCRQVFSSVYVLASHRTKCNVNPKKDQRDSVFEAVV